METKHTPGPWTAEWVKPNKAQGHTFEPRCWISGTDSDVGRVRLADIPDPIDDNAEANARLIAAAPDLLHALKELQSVIHEYRLLDVRKRFSLCTADAQAGSAIAKATVPTP